MVYAVVHQASGVSRGLLAAKSRLAKKGLTIPRLELVSAHMAANLAENVKNALEGRPVGQSMDGWIVLWPFTGSEEKGAPTSNLWPTE